MKGSLTLLLLMSMQLTVPSVWGDSLILPGYQFSKGNNWVVAAGSWVGDSPESGDPYFEDFVIQTSELRCQKIEGKCFEARALLKGRVMFTNLNEYKIQQWDSEKVIAVLDGTAATIEITFDMNKGRVSLAHVEKSDKRLDRAHLADGSEVIKKATKK